MQEILFLNNHIEKIERGKKMLNNIKKKVKRILKPKVKWILYKIIYPKFYELYRNKKIKKHKVVFIEPNLTYMSDSLKLLYDKIALDRDYNVQFLTLRQHSDTFYKKLKLSFKALRNVADAKVIFIDEACLLLSACNLRKETKLINVWHGCGAFKKFGWSTADLIFGASREEQLKYPPHRNYAFVTVSAPEVVKHFAEAMRLENEVDKILPIGVSRTDVFFDKDFIKKAYEKVYSIVPQAKNKKILLYAPTFRGRVANAKTSNALNIELLYYHLKDEYVILIKHHPIVKKRPAIKEEFKDFAIDVTDSLTIEDLICTSDVCIADYSSLVFEYSLFERPIIFFAYDMDNFLDWRGFYYKYEDFVPGPIVKNNIELLEAIKDIDNFDKQKVIDFKNKFMSACDGHSTERILEKVNEYMKN